MSRRQTLSTAKRIVIKIGSALLTNDGKGLDKSAMAGWVAQIAQLRLQGLEVVLVSSGAVAEGMNRLGWLKRPESLHELQAAAAVGQMGLVQAYEVEFQRYQLHTAQILLVHDDLSDRKRYLNARNTLQTLITLGVVPVVNENDTVATDEIRFGDNDTLGAVVANTIDADLLIILTDQDGMYDADPRKNPEAKLISEVKAGSEHLMAMASGGGELGRGGMTTKVRAADLAARSGTDTIIVGGRIKDAITRIMHGEDLGTLLYSEQEPLEARKLWLAGLMKCKGSLVLDNGAVTALKKGGVSLLPIGVSEITGVFAEGDMVSCIDTSGNEIAKGLVNYPSADAIKIKGLASNKLADVLGYQGEPELIHCDNLVIL
jgi:glutamate 5-kinase